MENRKNTYRIAYHGLSVGTHNFNFECDSDFFNRLSGGIYQNGNCSASIELEKGANLITLNITINGELECECDRCLDMFMIDINYFGSLFVKFSQEIDEPSFDSDIDSETDILWMNPADNYIDLEQFLYESIVLSLPNRRIHPNDENGNSLCDADMLARFTPTEETDSIEELENNFEDDDY